MLDLVRTCLLTFLSNPKLLCPRNTLYGARVKGFVASRIHYFSEVEREGKPWQLRSVKVGKNWFIVPFVVDSGGLSWKLPIISFQAMKKIGLGHVDKSLLNSVEKHDHLLEMPTPLGNIPTPLFSDWDYDRRQKFALDDIRFNLVGHELAAILIEINLLVSAGNLPDEYRNQLITQILRNYSCISSLNFEAIGNEIDAMHASMASGKPWNKDSLPFDDTVFV